MRPAKLTDATKELFGRLLNHFRFRGYFNHSGGGKEGARDQFTWHVLGGAPSTPRRFRVEVAHDVRIDAHFLCAAEAEVGILCPSYQCKSLDLPLTQTS